MTGVLIRRGNVDTDMEEKVMEDRGGAWSQGMPEAEGDLEWIVPHDPPRNSPANTWISDFWPPEL